MICPLQVAAIGSRLRYFRSMRGQQVQATRSRKKKELCFKIIILSSYEQEAEEAVSFDFSGATVGAIGLVMMVSHHDDRGRIWPVF